jgi:hypothetical protein
LGITSPSPPNTGRDRALTSPARPAAPPEASPAPSLVAVGVDRFPGGRDAVVLGSLLTHATRGELTLIADALPRPLLIVSDRQLAAR